MGLFLIYFFLKKILHKNKGVRNLFTFENK